MMSSDWVRYFFEIESDIVSWCSFVVKKEGTAKKDHFKIHLVGEGE
ncbi:MULTISPECIES: hypothetical protein [unclassified Paenibacillus]|nr:MULTISPECIES: hypothetical protein [unclassified Paenibacillus]